ncbi:MAG: hypothetical protein FJ050_05725 [Cyanobacteria bacterium M_surface_7_m2_040]|nr:hypothetical protein [Cyanobacteria bacterium K_Offshore_0m_m2_072]MBM5827540.1 hypothetical protein [Cyanobacteria bacterium M_surface_7_m2_040]
MTVQPSLAELEAEACRRGLLLRLQVNRPAGVAWTLRVGVARRQQSGALQLLGELKGWALPTADGLRLDTMRVQGEHTAGVGALIWAATFAWALEATPCRRATILAIRDSDRQHQRLVRYFSRVGFTPVRELGAGVLDLGPRLIWGGAGLLMQAECGEGLARSSRQLAQGDGQPASPA